MAALTVRNLSDETHRALKARAKDNHRSTEAEVRAILDAAVAPKVRLGSVLSAIGDEVGGVDLEFDRHSETRMPVYFS